ncbi:MAG: RluA family pseudouridine synthase [Clostridia bacterium]|nr:RluA family pseudouridine synthase [Clostridia bacterium]
MEKLEFKVNEKTDLGKELRKHLPLFSNYQIEKLFKNKDVKVNGVRKTKSCVITPNDNIEVYYQVVNDEPWFSIIFQDDNILIVNKRAGIEVISEDDRNLLDILKMDYNELYAVHRIDRNTEGLVVFAKNITAETELLKAFKERTIIKKYALKVKGKVQIEAIKHKLYLKKLADASKVIVSEVKTSGYEEIVTRFNLIKYEDSNTILEAELVTGKTHQIRAHISYFGHPIIGDGKYGVGDNQQMCLTAYYIQFKFGKKSALEYLNDKSFEILPTWWK